MSPCARRARARARRQRFQKYIEKKTEFWHQKHRFPASSGARTCILSFIGFSAAQISSLSPGPVIMCKAMRAQASPFVETGPRGRKSRFWTKMSLFTTAVGKRIGFAYTFLRKNRKNAKTCIFPFPAPLTAELSEKRRFFAKNCYPPHRTFFGRAKKGPARGLSSGNPKSRNLKNHRQNPSFSIISNCGFVERPAKFRKNRPKLSRIVFLEILRIPFRLAT